MIIRVITTLSLEEDDGTVIEEKTYGRAYLTEFDIREAATDWWKTHFHNRNRKLGDKKKKFTKDANQVFRIVHILTEAVKRTLFQKFLCNKDEIWEEFESSNKEI